MQNKRIGIQKNNKKRSILQTHITNNFKNYIIVTIIFLVRINVGSFIYKQRKWITERGN